MNTESGATRHGYNSSAVVVLVDAGTVSVQNRGDVLTLPQHVVARSSLLSNVQEAISDGYTGRLPLDVAALRAWLAAASSSSSTLALAGKNLAAALMVRRRQHAARMNVVTPQLFRLQAA